MAEAAARRLIPRNWTEVTAAIVVGLAVATAAGAANVATASGREWYDALEKPWFMPPGWVFGAVWTPIYALIALSGWMLWKSPGAIPAARTRALVAWSVQLGMNLLWTVLFFGLESPGLALLELVLLWGAIAWTILAALRVSRAAAVQLAPYAAWVLFAGALNFEVWRLNGYGW